MAQITKINDTTVAVISESKAIYSKSQLVSRKESLEAELTKVNELLEAFD